MGRDRDESGQFSDRVEPETVLEAFDARTDRARPLDAGEVADVVGIARRTALNKLNRLVDRGELETRKVGARGRVWWVPIPVDEPQSDATVRESVVEEPSRRDEPPNQPRTDASPTAARDRVEDVVDAITAGWDDTDDRLEARKSAAEAVLEHAVETGDAVGRSDAVDAFHDEYPVAGQNEETWWRKNVRDVLAELGAYSNAEHGYRVDRDDLEAFLQGEE